MKQIAFFSAAALLAAGALTAAATPRPGAIPSTSARPQTVQNTVTDRAKARLATIAQAVGDLSDDEKAKIQAIYEKAYKQQDDLKAQGKSGETVRDVLEGADSDAKKVLTDAQKSKFPRLRITG